MSLFGTRSRKTETVTSRRDKDSSVVSLASSRGTSRPSINNPRCTASNDELLKLKGHGVKHMSGMPWITHFQGASSPFFYSSGWRITVKPMLSVGAAGRTVSPIWSKNLLADLPCLCHKPHDQRLQLYMSAWCNPTWTQVSARPTHTVFVSNRSTGFSALTHQLDGNSSECMRFSGINKNPTFCSRLNAILMLQVGKLSRNYFEIKLFRFGFYWLTFNKHIISTNQVQG